KAATTAVSKGKKATASKATRKPRATANGAAAKKRSVRTMEHKIAENEPMSKPFYVERGNEWNATDIDFDDLAVLRRMWELPAACHILWLLQNPLKLRFSNTLLEFEAALLNPATSTLLEDVFTKLLLKKSERECLTAGIGLKYEWWNKQLREYYVSMYDKWYALLRKAGEKVPDAFLGSDDDDDDDTSSTENGRATPEIDQELTDDEWMTLDILKARLEALGEECPLRHKSFTDLSAELRCKVLLNLCEAVMDDPANTEYVRLMEEDDLRVEPFGRDRVGNLYFFFPQFYEERRIYRLDVTDNSWALWAKGDESFRAMLKAMRDMRGRRLRGEQELINHLEVILEQMAEEAVEKAKQLEKLTRKAILEAIPRKRSMRLQVKQLEQIEQQREEQQKTEDLTPEELAERKRTELLKKVEREAEKEAKKLQQEQREREAAAQEREQRRQRRLEQEKQEQAQQQKLEEARKRQEEARKLRAQQRQAQDISSAEDENGNDSVEEDNPAADTQAPE
ncbi:TPA: hypothetical protein N0F65_006998, partial [Lagenidium giganteum]